MSSLKFLSPVSFRKLGAAAVLSLAIATNADAVTVGGVASCGQWMQNHDASGSESTPFGSAQNYWAAGYLTGLAVESKKDILAATDPSSMQLWLTNYCRANPLNDIQEASHSLGRQLAQRIGTSL